MHLVLNASQCDTAGGLYNELHLPHPQLWKNKWNEGGGEGVVGLYRTKKGVQDQVSWTSVPHHHWCSCYSKPVSVATEVMRVQQSPMSTHPEDVR